MLIEVLRLADIEGLYEEETARRMGVSRAIFTRVLTEARARVAQALVERQALVIGGGPVRRCREGAGPGGRRWRGAAG